jgi:cell division protein FtsL
VSGPARGRRPPAAEAPRPRARARPRSRRPSGASAGTLALRLVARVRALPYQPLLDRLVRGRGWIAVLAGMLVVIVAMQVSRLGLGAQVGRQVAQASSLQAQNEQLRAQVGTLADDQRIESLAAGMGMVMPAPTTVTFLSATSSVSAHEAAGAISAPDPAGFAARQQATSQSSGG